MPFSSMSSVRHRPECTFTPPSLSFSGDLNAGSEATWRASEGVVTIPIPLSSVTLLFTKTHRPEGISGKGGVQVGGCVHGQGRSKSNGRGDEMSGCATSTDRLSVEDL
jgi:hypothetical protein